ncbi:hypothetical protein NL676_014175 [Syzygium grande]|nr:hypothetical protein NL676_014175 [Syzygium grande]
MGHRFAHFMGAGFRVKLSLVVARCHHRPTNQCTPSGLASRSAPDHPPSTPTHHPTLTARPSRPFLSLSPRVVAAHHMVTMVPTGLKPPRPTTRDTAVDASK